VNPLDRVIDTALLFLVRPALPRDLVERIVAALRARACCCAAEPWSLRRRVRNGKN
jgi:hypothetical protein